MGDGQLARPPLLRAASDRSVQAGVELLRVAKKDRPSELWKGEPDEHDYPAASDYLSLLLEPSRVESTVALLRQAAPVDRKAKDLLRASRLATLPVDNVHVAADLKKVERGERLSPVLLVRGRADADVALIVADGYHRICASYHLDENADIPCRIVDLP
jgi:hypothetical protein